MTKYLIFFLKYYPNCVSILYKKCCRAVLLTKKRTFFTIVFFCKCFELCTLPSRDLFPHFFSMLTSTDRAVEKYPTEVLLYWPRAIARSTQQDLGWLFPRTACPHPRSVSYYYSPKVTWLSGNIPETKWRWIFPDNHRAWGE
jgi:hypothetical protein